MPAPAPHRREAGHLPPGTRRAGQRPAVGEADLARMKALSDIGLQLSVTGGITPADLPLFKQINVKAFIAGRALAGAANPPQVAEAFHSQIRDIWGA